MVKKLSSEEEILAQKLARYENTCEKHSVELRRFTKEDVLQAYEKLKQQSGYVGQAWEPTQTEDQAKYTAHLETICASKAQSIIDHYRIANAAATLLVCTMRWDLAKYPITRQDAIELRTRDLVHPPVLTNTIPVNTQSTPAVRPSVPAPQPTRIIHDRDSLLEHVFKIGDGDDIKIWQVTEMRANRKGWTYVVIDGDGQSQTLDENTLQSRLASSVIV